MRRLAARVETLEARLVALERLLASRDAAATAPASEADSPGLPFPDDTVAALARIDPRSVLTASGRLFIVLGGAFLLRAITEAGLIAPGAGVTLGLLYAVTWVAMAGRSSSRGDLMGSGFYGVAAALIGYPLIGEAAWRFGLLPPAVAAASLVVFTGLFLAVARHERRQLLAWIAMSAAIPLGIALVAMTGAAVPVAVAFVVLGVATLWLGYELEWVQLRWPAALVADLLVAGLLLRVLREPPLDPVAWVLGVQGLLLSGYLGSIAVRTLVRGRDVVPFEVVQTVAVLVVVLGGGLSLARVSAGGAAMAWVALLLAALAYGVAFAFLDPRQGRGVNFYFYSSLAIVFALAGSGALVPPSPRAVVWSVLAVAITSAAGRFRRLTLAYHGAVYLAGAALAAGVLHHAAGRLAGAPAVPLAGWPELLVLASAVAVCRLPPATGPSVLDWWGRAYAIVAAVVLLLGGTGLAAALGTVAVESIGPAPFPPGVSAAVRTTALAVGAIVAAWLGTWPGLRMFGVLVYPVLAVTGVKLLVEDLPVSEPATLFVSLAAFGAALVVAPRFARRR